MNAGGLVDASARGSSATRDIAITTTWVSTVGDRAINEARGQFATRRVDLNTPDSQGPGILIPGIVEFGRPSAGNGVHDQRYIEAGDLVRWTAGRHFFSVGAEVTDIRITGSTVDGTGGTYLFRSLDTFAAGQPENFRQVFANAGVRMAATRFGAFAQDRWTPQSAVTIDLGARFDGESMPSSLGIRSRVISPRVGIAWTPRPNWVIRGGAGVFADRLVLAAFERGLLVNGRQGFEQIVEGTAAAAVLREHGGRLDAALPNVASSIYTARQGEWRPRSRQLSAGIERGLTTNLTASVNYLFVQGRDLPRTVNVNLAPPTAQFGRSIFGSARLNSAYSDIFELHRPRHRCITASR